MKRIILTALIIFFGACSNDKTTTNLTTNSISQIQTPSSQATPEKNSTKPKKPSSSLPKKPQKSPDSNKTSSKENLKSDQNFSKICSLDVKVIFSKNSGSFSGGGDDEIIKTIQEANSSIFLAMYDFTNDKIKDALIDAKDRGVDVEIVTDDSKVDDEDYQDLKNGDIPIFDDNNSNALMHNKFMIIDQRMLWSGSANYTYYSFYRNSENIILIKDKKVAKTYLEEFKELKNHTFVKNPYISECVEVYFSPEDHFETKLIDLINQAKESVEFLIFAFTNKEIADALIRAKKRGLRIRGVFDEKQNEYQKYSKYNYLLENGLDVKLYGGNFKLHDKVMIIDKKIVVTGSYNFTVQADEKNSENSLVIYKKELANKYEKEFQRIYENAN